MSVEHQELYRPGATLLHRLDPRLKVLACLLLVVLAFSAGSWMQLCALAAVMAAAAWPHAGPLRSVCWMLRWLFLFTLLMHLLFSPGRTLFGSSWLSLDGLLTGFRVCLQMLLAITASALLAATTSTASLADTFGWLVRPMRILGCRTEEWQKLLLLSLDFLPIVRQELRAGAAPDGENSSSSPTAAREGRWSRWMRNIEVLLARLLDRGDTIAHRIAANEGDSSAASHLEPLLPMALHDRCFLLALLPLIAGYWVLG